MYYNLILQNLN